MSEVELLQQLSVFTPDTGSLNVEQLLKLAHQDAMKRRALKYVSAAAAVVLTSVFSPTLSRTMELTSSDTSILENYFGVDASQITGLAFANNDFLTLAIRQDALLGLTVESRFEAQQSPTYALQESVSETTMNTKRFPLRMAVPEIAGCMWTSAVFGFVEESWKPLGSKTFSEAGTAVHAKYLLPAENEIVHGKFMSVCQAGKDNEILALVIEEVKLLGESFAIEDVRNYSSVIQGKVETTSLVGRPIDVRSVAGVAVVTRPVFLQSFNLEKSALEFEIYGELRSSVNLKFTLEDRSCSKDSVQCVSREGNHYRIWNKRLGFEYGFIYNHALSERELQTIELLLTHLMKG